MSILSHKKVLVTGGAGFIGTNLCEALLANDNEVIAFDNLATGLESNLDECKKNSKFSFVKGDITNLEEISDALNGVDIVMHQAALGSVPRSIHNPLDTNMVNITGFLTVLEACKKNNIKRVVYASSSSVYGDIKDSPKVEYSIGKQLSPYAVSKYVNEQYAAVFSDLYGLELIGLRYFNVFGKYQRPDGAYAAAIPRFISSLMQCKAPTIYGDGEQTRDFTYIKNVIHAINCAASVNDPQAINQVYNVAFGQAVSVNDLVNTIQNKLKTFVPDCASVSPNHEKERIGDVRASLADVSKAKKHLKYNPQYSFEQGLDEAIAWYVEKFKE